MGLRTGVPRVGFDNSRANATAAGNNNDFSVLTRLARQNVNALRSLDNIPAGSAPTAGRSRAFGYFVLGLSMVWFLENPGKVFGIATMGYNFALSFSCLHTLAINTRLLPRELRPHLLIRVGLVLGSVFFAFLGVMSVLKKLELI